MQVKVFEGDTLIGEAQIYALDPPMGVAMGKFEPALAYEVERHANVVDGDYIADRSEILRTELADGTHLKSQAVSIQDFPTLHEMELHIWGIVQPAFNKLFAEHPSVKLYWG